MKLMKQEQSPSSVRQTFPTPSNSTNKAPTLPHPNLARLQQLKPTLSYPGWEEDYKTEEKMHKIFPLEAFEKCLFRLQEKQRMHEGNRSHPRLKKLDKRKWSYPKWKQDFRQAEEYHVWNRKETTRSFEQVYNEMKSKEREFRRVAKEFDERQQERRQQRRQREAKQDEIIPSSPPFNQHACTICMEAPRSHVFIPCGHMTACESCSITAFKRNKACPICRKSSTMVTKVYLS